VGSKKGLRAGGLPAGKKMVRTKQEETDNQHTQVPETKRFKNKVKIITETKKQDRQE